VNRIVAALVGLTLFVSACGVSRSVPALTADFGDTTREISFGTLDAVVGPTSQSEDFVQLVFGGSVPDTFRAGVLTEQLALEALKVELDELGLEVSDEELESSKDQLLVQVESLYSTSPDPQADAVRLYDEVPYLSFLAEYQATQGVFADALAETADPAEGGQPCVRHILVDTEPEADDILVRLGEGEDFSALAAELSTGPSGPNGGELGCAAATNYVPEFANAVIEAELGEFVGPVQTQFGFHVLVVDSYEIDSQALAGTKLRERLGQATIDVDETVGTWDEVQLVITPAPSAGQ
jgi:hypothetical protein